MLPVRSVCGIESLCQEGSGGHSQKGKKSRSDADDARGRRAILADKAGLGASDNATCNAA